MDNKDILEEMKEYFGASSIEEVAQKMGYSEKTASTWRSRGISKAALNKFALIKSNDSNRAFAEQSSYLIDVLSLQASAGTGVENYQVEVIDTVSIPRIFFRTPQNPAALKVIQVVGDSMEPTLRDGSYILVDTAAVDVVDGIYAIIIGSEIFVKRLQFNLDGTIDIISDNPAYETKRYDPSAQGDVPVRVIGRKVLTVQ